MNGQTRKRSLSIVAVASVLALAFGNVALAQSHSHGGGGHAAAGAAHGGYAGRGGYGARAGYGYRGGYGYHGGYGWRGGYGYYGWGWGWGLGLGLYFATLPYYYSTLWWDGVPYYYADNTYYSWDPRVGQYVTVAPPAGLANQDQAAASTAPSELIAYPKNGQSEAQQAKDKFECHSWAAHQTGFDPTQGSQAPAGPNARDDYMRAQAACLDARGYSVR